MFFIWALPVLAEENLAETCQMEKIEERCQNIEPAECRKLLEKCEEYYTKESERIAADISKTEKEKKTLKNKITTLKKKIEDLNLQIKQNNLIIKDLTLQIEDTHTSIEKTTLKIEDSKEKLSAVLRSLYEEDQKPATEVLLTGSNLSDFFDNLMALEVLNSKSKDLLQNIKTLKSNLEQQKISLDNEKGETENVLKIQTLQKQETAKTKSEQENYLKLTEEEYQKQLKEKEETKKKAAEIRARIFELIGVPKAPTFGEAYEIAKYVGELTGVRPAFLLAVLTQESNIGKNVGQCYVSNLTTGEGIRINTSKKEPNTMHPQRDIPHFIEITKAVGRDPLSTLVSCPMSFGWGGAMGPAQFIPSTWAIYDNRVSSLTGRSADPWNINDAFLAAALYLSDYGAAKKTANDEWRAALVYFSGSVNTKYRFYADSVAKIAKGYEDDIKAIENGDK